MIYDAIIVGAGPAGGQCARELSQAGAHVLLLEKSKDFSVNNYSSAGAPMDIMEDYTLPTHIVGTTWNKFSLHSSFDQHTWSSSEQLGVVMDFKKLRAFLAEEMQKQGGELSLGCAYHHHEITEKGTRVWVKRAEESSLLPIHTKVLVDATGGEREILRSPHYDKRQGLVATGIEFLVSVSPEIYRKYAECLSFFMGSKWMPQGYAWIFPMEEGHLKVGIGRYFIHDNFVSHHNSFRYYLDHMFAECLGIKDPMVLDKHGKTLYYTYGRADLHHQDNIISIGDAVSTLNPLGCEGIRHAMLSGRLASKYILQYLGGKKQAFNSYDHEMKRNFNWKWRLSEFLTHKIYKEANDHNINLFIKAFQGLSTEEMMDMAFKYQLKPGMKFYLRLLGLKMLNNFTR